MKIKNLLGMLILLFAANSHANVPAFGDVSTCGLVENSKLVDAAAITVCPQNISEQIKNSFFGDDSRAFLRDSLPQEQASLKNDAQRFVDARNQSTFTIANKAMFSLVLLFSIGYGIWNIIKLTFAAGSGDVAFGPGERYSILYNVMFSLLGIILFVPIGNLAAFQKYAVIGLDNFGSSMSQIVLQSYAAQQERGNLETSQKDVDGSEISHPQTQYKSNSLTMSVLTHALLIRQTSAKYNYFFNVSNTNDYELVSPISKIVKREGNRLLFEVENPEKPGQIIYSADPIVFNYVKNGGTAQNECLKAIGFDRKYSSRFDINNIENDIIELKNDIVQSCVTDTSTVQYQTFLNSLLSMYVTNLTTNWISTTTKRIYTDGTADKIAELAMNAMCADDESARMSARQYVATRRYGAADCVGSDWKVLGESKTAEEYRKEASSELIKINDEYYSGLLRIQTALLKAFENADSLQRGKEIVQQGFFGAVQEMMTFRNDQNNASMFLSNFNDNSLGTFLTAKCADSCIDDKWLKAQSNYSESEYPFNTQLFIKDIYSLTEWSDVAPQPTLDGGAMTQNLLIEQSGKNEQSEIYETSVFLSLENPRKVFDRCMTSALHPATCLAMYGSSLVTTGIHIKELAVAVKFLAAIQERVTSDSRKGHDAKEDEAAAKIGDKAKKQKSSFISSFAGISQFASILGNSFDIFATLLITGGLINYVLLPSLMTFSFQALAILSQYYVLCLVLFSTTLLAVFVRPNDSNNFKSIGVNIGKLLGFIVCHKPIITLGFLLNMTLSDIFTKSFFPTTETLIGSIAALVGGDLMQSVVMVIVRFALSFFIIMITLYASLSLVFKALRLFDSNLFFLNHVMKATERFKGVSNLLGFMLPGVFTSLAGGVARGGSRIILKSFKKRGD